MSGGESVVMEQSKEKHKDKDGLEGWYVLSGAEAGMQRGPQWDTPWESCTRPSRDPAMGAWALGVGRWTSTLCSMQQPVILRSHWSHSTMGDHVTDEDGQLEQLVDRLRFEDEPGPLTRQLQTRASDLRNGEAAPNGF
jgi:hypothetical protein